MKNSTNSYQVTSPYAPDGYRNYGYSSYAGSHQEMNEFSANGYRMNGYENGHNRSASVSKAKAPVVDDDDDEDYDRGHWGSKAEFILSCVGYSVGIGNVWRFPYLAYANGGGAFLLPYVILLVFVGKAMYYMETSIGQFSRTSPLQLWRCAPIAKGVGFGMLVLSLIVSIYYNVIMAYSIIYIGASFTGINGTLPWTVCDPEWGADLETCIATSENNTELNAERGLQRCRPEFNITVNCTYLQTSTTQYWEKYVLNITDQLSDTPGDLGGFKYDLPLALLLSWIVVFLCLMKGVKSSGKVVYFTATFPYVILITLLVVGVLQEGAGDGIYYLFVPDFNKLKDFTVWRKAAEQMFFSLGIAWGGLIMFGSYNKFHNKIHIDAAIVSSLDFITSLIASVVIFSVLGHLAAKTGVRVDQVAEKGQGLAFVTYPEALSLLPLPWLWSVLFFFMLFFLGLDSEFALLETVLTAIYDGSPKLRNHKVKVTFVACCICYLLGLPCVSFSGQYVLDLMDTYGAGFAVLFIAFFEIVGLMWIYGVRNFCKDIKLMLGHEPSWFWKICWGFISPIFLLVIFIAAAVTWEAPKYSKVIPYPEWAHIFGWCLFGVTAIQVPLWAIIMTIYYAAKGKISQVIKPTSKWGPGDKEVRRAILDEQSGISRGGKYVYDNDGMPYNAYHM